MNGNRAIALSGLLLVLTVAVFEATPLDLLVQDHLYDPVSGWTVDRDSPVPRWILYDGPKVLFAAIGVLFFCVAAPDSRVARLSFSRREAAFLFACLSLAPLTVLSLKETTGVFAPRKLERYGGQQPYRTILQSIPYVPGRQRGHAFPAAHCSGTFALMGLYYVVKGRVARRWALALGLTTGWSVGLYQMMKGAHFLSHTIVTMILVWTIVQVLSRAFGLGGAGASMHRDGVREVGSAFLRSRNGVVMRVRLSSSLVLALTLASFAKYTPAAAAPSAAVQPKYAVESVAIPNAPPGGLFLDYLAVDRTRGRVWVPAGGTGTTLVIDAKSRKVHRVDNFKTAEVERRGQKRIVGPSSASVGDGFVYVGNRGDSSVCAIDAAKLARAGCVTLPGSPDGVVYVAKTKEVWVTVPRDQSIVVLDVSTAAAPKVATTFKLEGSPEGYAVDEARGLFYTNLEDKDQTLRIDLAAKRTTATWPAQCGEEGPRGLALDPSGRFLMNVCHDHVEVMDAHAEGKVLSKLDTGEGVDAVDYVPSTRSLYAAAGRAGRLTIAHLGDDGALTVTATVEMSQGARNAVATDDGTVFVADGPEGKVLVVRPSHAHE